MYIKLFFVLIFIASLLKAEINIEKRNGGYVETENFKVIFNNNGFEIISSTGNSTLNKTAIEGIKDILFSPNQNYMLVINFAFRKDKEPYDVSYFLFNNNGEKIRERTITAHFDVPHPLFCVNDFGVILIYQPDYLFFNIDDGELSERIWLEKDAQFEMERTPYILAKGKFFYLITNLYPASLEYSIANTLLAEFDSDTKTFTTEIINLSMPTYLDKLGDDLIISGVKYENMSLIKKCYLFSDGKIKSEINGMAFEKIIRLSDSRSVGFFGKELFLIGSDFQNVVNTAGEWDKIFSIYLKEKTLFVIALKNNNLVIYSSNVEIFDNFEEQAIFESTIFNKVISTNKGIYIIVNNATIILQ